MNARPNEVEPRNTRMTAPLEATARLVLGLGWFPFGFPQPEQQQKKRDEGKDKEDGATAMVDGRIDHLGTDVRAEFAKDEDAEAIPQQREREDDEHEKRPFPR